MAKLKPSTMIPALAVSAGMMVLMLTAQAAPLPQQPTKPPSNSQFTPQKPTVTYGDHSRPTTGDPNGKTTSKPAENMDHVVGEELC
ncbi:MAG: hypothetical protein HQ514_21055 [Rhodospirillales bacterium]|nr:hypothetical protein [Rhodospirillales bacterium]